MARPQQITSLVQGASSIQERVQAAVLPIVVMLQELLEAVLFFQETENVSFPRPILPVELRRVRLDLPQSPIDLPMLIS